MRIKRKSAIIFFLLLESLLAYTALTWPPIRTGKAEVYWEFACGIELNKFAGYFPYAHWTGIFPDSDGWFYYFYQEHHGRHVFKVSQQALMATVDEVYTLLDVEIKSTLQKKHGYGENSFDSLKSKNARRSACLQIRTNSGLNREQFIQAVREQARKAIRKEVVAKSEVAKEYRNRELKSFQHQLERSQYYWISVLFEAIFLPLWWLFSFHAGVFGNYNRSLAVRLAFSPLLLFVPHYLGYAPYLFSFGPSGGIIYPTFALLMSLPFGWLPFNSVEISFLKLLPQPLAYISQVPYSPMAISFRGAVSPTVLILYALLVFGINKVWLKYFKRIKETK